METTKAWQECSGWFSIDYWEQEWHIQAKYSFQLHLHKIVSIPWFFGQVVYLPAYMYLITNLTTLGAY